MKFVKKKHVYLEIYWRFPPTQPERTVNGASSPAPKYYSRILIISFIIS